MWLVLGLRKYKNAHGSWPTSLEDASEYVPPEALLDLFESAFVYILGGDCFILYSKGPNGIDESGRNVVKSGDDIMIWPLGEKGALK